MNSSSSLNFVLNDNFITKFSFKLSKIGRRHDGIVEMIVLNTYM